jgi:steroid delta-isomerase-like uncharacterized protein
VPTPAEALAAARDAINAGDLERYLELYDERIAFHGVLPEPMDKAAVRGFYQALFAGLESPRLDVQEELWDGDRVASRFTLSGRHVGDFLGVPATGRQVVLRAMTTMRFDGDRVVERHTVSDVLGVLASLGALPGGG